MPADAPDKAELYFFEEFEALLVAFGDAAAIAVDMPIGLPDRRTGAGRACEVEARARLGARQSSVFSIPARGAVMAGDYAEACNVALETSDPPRKVSKQAFMLFPKIREIDLCWEDGMEGHLFECHPELAFWALNGGRPMALPKKVKSRNNPPGLDERARALEAAGFAPGFLVHGNTERMPGKARRDDLLDACVCAWSAARISRGEGIAFPEEPEFDGLGRPMSITV